MDALCFNPRTPCGVRRESVTVSANSTSVSIHALLAECDKWAFGLVSAVCCFNPRTPCGVRPRWQIWTWCTCGFQSTHSLRSATSASFPPSTAADVSIHALLAECDRTSDRIPEPFSCFNPRTPCGVRQASQITSSFCTRFQSTHSLRSATGGQPRPISDRKFQSTHSLRSATEIIERGQPPDNVSIHALLAECDPLGRR